MSYIASIGLAELPYKMNQHDIKVLSKEIFSNKKSPFKHVMSVFDNAKINERQLSAPSSWYKENHSFNERNDLYHSLAIEYSLHAIDHCLKNKQLLNGEIPYEAIDMIIYISSTGISTPSIDTYIMNERPFKSSVIRMPLWGLGCAGGAMGLSRAFEWIQLHKDKTALIICCELCSLTFQKDDQSISNIVGTALFGDGVAAALVVGEDSPYKKYCKKEKMKIRHTSSWTEKGTTNIMGWELINSGFKVIFNKRIPKLVQTLWKKHVGKFLNEQKLLVEDIATFIAHPGGRKVLEEMEMAFSLDPYKLTHSYDVLYDHGNMSSVTVLYVLARRMLEGNKYQNKNEIICALGPGFSSELLLVEWGR